MEQQNGKSILGVISDVLLIILIIVAIAITVMTFTSKSSETGVGNILGFTPFSVQTSSMEPTIDQGDLIISKEVKQEEAVDGKSLKVGDVITFSTVMSDNAGNTIRGYNTHRIVDVTLNDDGTVFSYATKGDAIGTEDSTPVTPYEIIAKQIGASADIVNGQPVNIKKGVTIMGLGKALDFLQTQLGFMVCVIIPLALFFIWQVYKLIAMFMSAKSENISDDIKRKAIEEYLAQQEAAKKAAADAEENK
ncbi:MAG: signal peptidase I [Clostridia bacterium]|nr:signal peptidase I [Clostridia bacterium]